MKSMSDKIIIIFFVLLGISFITSVIYNDTQILMNWVYSLMPLVLAIAVLLINESTKRKRQYIHR